MGSFLAPWSGLEASKNAKKSDRKTNLIKSAIWEPFGVDFGPIWGPFWEGLGSRFLLFLLHFENFAWHAQRIDSERAFKASVSSQPVFKQLSQPALISGFLVACLGT